MGPEPGLGQEGTQPRRAEQRQQDGGSREPRTRAGVRAPGRVICEHRRTGRVCLEMTVPAGRGTTTAGGREGVEGGGQKNGEAGCLKDHPRGGRRRQG